MNYLARYFFTQLTYWSALMTKLDESESLDIKKWLRSAIIFFAPQVIRSARMTKCICSGNSTAGLIECSSFPRISLYDGKVTPEWYDDS